VVRIVRLVQATVIVAGMLAALACASVVLLPRVFGWSTLVVLSGSMEPSMPEGGLAFVEPLQGEAIHVGDVVTYQRPDQRETLVSHRVHAISDHLGEPTIWTIGDANESPDPWAVTTADITGRVRFTLPFLGDFSRYVRTGRGVMVLVAPVAALVVLTELISIGANARRLRRTRLQESSNEAEQRLLLSGDTTPSQI
jgi:signal peptidase